MAALLRCRTQVVCISAKSIAVFTLGWVISKYVRQFCSVQSRDPNTSLCVVSYPLNTTKTVPKHTVWINTWVLLPSLCSLKFIDQGRKSICFINETCGGIPLVSVFTANQYRLSLIVNQYSQDTVGSHWQPDKGLPQQLTISLLTWISWQKRRFQWKMFFLWVLCNLWLDEQ